MKKFLKAILFLCALSSLAYAEEAAPVVTSGTTMSAEDQKDAMDILDRMRARIEKEEEAKPKTEAERLELTRKKAMNKLDFYERVVRSVAREEAEVAGYYEIMGEQKERPSIMDEQNQAPSETVEVNTQETTVEEAK